MNPRVAGVAAPPIPAVRAWGARYDGRHGPLIDLTQAVPGYPAHPGLVERLGQAAAEPESFAYGSITGDAALREAFAAETSRLYGGLVSPDEVAITTGANMASFAVTMLLAGAGDAVMLPVPWYFNHQMNAAMLGVEVVPLPCRAGSGFVPDVEEAARLLTPHVKAILLVSPNNPTGTVYPPDVIARFGALARERGICLVVDETYRDFLPAGPVGAGAGRPHDLFTTNWREHVIQLYSFSKSYCVPGYRAGAVVAGEPVVSALATVLDCLQICAPRVGQAGLAWAVAALRDWREDNRALMNARSDACAAAFDTLDGWDLAGRGSYFAYLRHPGPGSSWPVAERLATQFGLLTLPGEAFGPGQDGYLRLAFANVEPERLAEAARRLRQAGA